MKSTENSVKFDHVIFTRATLCLSGTCRHRVSVRLSVTSLSSTKTAKPMVKQPMPYDSPGTLVYLRHKSRQISNGGQSNGGHKVEVG